MQEYVLKCLVVINIVYLVGREATLDTFCCGTKLEVTFELANRSSADVWKACFLEWVLHFLGPPQILVVDSAGEYVCDEFRQNCKSIGIELLEKATDTQRVSVYVSD